MDTLVLINQESLWDLIDNLDPDHETSESVEYEIHNLILLGYTVLVPVSTLKRWKLAKF